jgi:hypothetical protein
MAKPIVIWIDETDKREPAYFLAALLERLDHSAAFAQARDWWGERFVVLSERELAEDEIYAAMWKSRAAIDLEEARYTIVDVPTAVEAYENLFISARNVNGIAKAKGFKMPNGWYISGHKNCLSCAQGAAEHSTSQTVGSL